MVASTVLAAMVGVIGAAVVTMALVALPSMLRRGYSPVLAVGTVMAGGTLGILIPPSVLAIVYGLVANQSVGELTWARFSLGWSFRGCTFSSRWGMPS